MKVIRELDRRTVVTAYLRYDSAKKDKPLPDISSWDWTSADSIDKALKKSGYKCGIPAGFCSWKQVELTVDDLRNCAVVETISRELRPQESGEEWFARFMATEVQV